LIYTKFPNKDPETAFGDIKFRVFAARKN